MKILLLADEADPFLWEHLKKSRLEGVDLVLAAGDLPASYLSFLTCFTSAPILYVHGNHDDRYHDKPPLGCECIEDTIFVYKGLRILGLGGSMRYKPGENQYTEEDMEGRIRHLRRALKKAGGFDLLLAHAPLRGIGDTDDRCHTGFQALRDLVDVYHPAWFVHGHVHQSYTRDFHRIREYGSTQIINAYVSWTLELDVPDDGLPVRKLE